RYQKVYLERVVLEHGRRTLQEIAADVGKTRERIRQLEVRVSGIVSSSLEAESEGIRALVGRRLMHVSILLEELGASPQLAQAAQQEEIENPEVIPFLTLLRVSACKLRGD